VIATTILADAPFPKSLRPTMRASASTREVGLALDTKLAVETETVTCARTLTRAKLLAFKVVVIVVVIKWTRRTLFKRCTSMLFCPPSVCLVLLFFSLNKVLLTSTDFYTLDSAGCFFSFVL
jgi:hypothetical protein